jgi:hypothetical protein
MLGRAMLGQQVPDLPIAPIDNNEHPQWNPGQKYSPEQHFARLIESVLNYFVSDQYVSVGLINADLWLAGDRILDPGHDDIAESVIGHSSHSISPYMNPAA